MDTQRSIVRPGATVDQADADGSRREQSVDRLETLSEISRVVASTLDLYPLYETIYQQVSRVMDTTQFFIALDWPERGVVTLPYHWEDGRTYDEEELPYGLSATAMVIQQGASLLFHSDAEYQSYVRENGLPELTVGQDASEAKIWVPLNTGNKTIGALSVQSTRKEAYTQDDVTTLTIIGVQAAVAIENARLFSEQRARVHQLQELEKALRQSQNRYRSVIETSSDAIVMCDLQGIIMMVNPAGFGLLGLSIPDELIGESVFELVLEKDRSRASGNLEKRLTGELPPEVAAEYTLCRRDGGTFLAEVHSSVLLDDEGKPTAFTVVARDITERKRLEEELKYQAVHDALTGLPNRLLFQDRFQQAITLAQRNQESVALLLMDLDRFKEVNDAFGHHYGDLLLEAVGCRLQNTLRASDTVARLGGDEFAVLLLGANERGASQVASKLLAAMELPFVIEGHLFRVDTSIGIVVYPIHGQDPTTLLKHGDAAMYAAKRTNGRRVVYRLGQEESMPERLELTGDLVRALERDEFVLEYQPKLDLTSGAVAGVEALVRWKHPSRGMLLPEQFIPVMEQTGLIRLLTRRVLVSALHQCRRWHEVGLHPRIAINLSLRDLHNPTFPQQLMDTVRAWSVSPAWLEVEITERAIMRDPALVIQTLNRLREVGIAVAIDDFGMGFSCLAYLKQMPVDALKIDRSFVVAAASDQRDAKIIGSIIDLGHNLDMRVVAEGVENEETRDLLQAMGCDVIQGYHVAPPMPAAELVTWLEGFELLSRAS